MQTKAFEIKEVKKLDFNKIIDLWSLAFNIEDADPTVGTRHARDSIIALCERGMDYIVGAYDGDYLASAAAVIEFPMHFGGEWITCGGLAGVATHPQYRRQGLVKMLVTDCLRSMNKREIPISALWPFEYEFYAPMGYATTNRRLKVDLLTKTLAHVKGNSRNYKAVELGEQHEAKAAHKRWIGNYNLSMERSAFRWMHMLFPPGSRRRLYVHRDGYMIWNLSASFEKILQIQEWCYLTEEAFRDGIALLAQLDSQYDHAVYFAAETETLYKVVGPSKSQNVQSMPGMMTRVVNVDAFMNTIKAPNTVSIRDPLGISGAVESGEGHPGELIQHVTGFWSEPQAGLPLDLYKKAAALPAYSAEMY
ncbi:MAG TPA: GNAT family N-acetyltransferase [Drouetiella sp.]